MGLRDTVKKAAGTVAAGLSIALAPGAARAMDTAGDVIVAPRLVLPSQEVYQSAPESLMGEPEPLHLRVVKHPAFAGAIGLCATGFAGVKVMEQVNKKQASKMRDLLASSSGVDIDASILDEVNTGMGTPLLILGVGDCVSTVALDRISLCCHSSL